MITKAELAKLERLRDKAAKASKEYTAHLRALANHCDHPSSHVREERSNSSNGFGRTITRKINVCLICLAENHWGKWSGPNPWATGEYSREDD